MIVKIKKLNEKTIIPTKATNGAACFDVYIHSDYIITKGRNVIPLGFSIELEQGTYAEIRPRSGFSAKGIEGKDGGRYDADVIHGCIDEDFRGDVGVIIRSNDSFTLAKGTRIAQMLIAKYEDITFNESYTLSETDRLGGFGSTGTK